MSDRPSDEYQDMPAPGQISGTGDSGIGIGSFISILGLMLFAANAPVGLVFVIFGFVCIFTGMANQQEHKRLRAARQMKQLLAPPGPSPDQQSRVSEDWARASAVRSAPVLPVLPVSIPLRGGEFACYRTPATLAEARQFNRLSGGYMAFDALPAASDEGELYVTSLRVVFSGRRESRDIPLSEIALVSPHDGLVELQRYGRPAPTIFGVPFPRHLAAYIERARPEGPAALPGPPSIPALGPAMSQPNFVAPVESVPSGTIVSPGMTARPHPIEPPPVQAPIQDGPTPASDLPSYVTCAHCGAANGLSANFCQNCAAPITRGTTPTLNYGA